MEQDRLKRLAARMAKDAAMRPSVREGQAAVVVEDPEEIERQIAEWKVKLAKAADLEMFGVKNKPAAKPKEE